MKKIIALMATLILAVSGAFANIELSANLMFSPSYTSTMKDGNNTADVSVTFPVGEEVKANFFFYSSKHFDIGLNVSQQILLFKNIEIDGTNNEYDSAADFSIVIGPTFRFNLNNMHGFFVSPGIIGTLSVAGDTEGSITETLINADLGFNLDAGYRLWLLNTDAFHLGMDVGAQYSISGGAGTIYLTDSNSDFSYDSSYDLNTVQRFKIYLGVIMNFGDRGWDKQ